MSRRSGGGGGGSGTSSGGASQNVFSASNVYIDALNGNDGNTGLSSGQAWKTNQRLASAIGVYGLVTTPGTGKRYFSVNYINQMPSASDILNLQIVLDADVSIRFVGTALITTVHTGTFSAAVGYTNSNTLASVTDAGVNWTSAGYVGDRIQWTAGASVGAIAWVAKDLTSGQARISQPCIPNDPILSTGTRPTLKAPTTDTYAVQTLPLLYVGMMVVNSNSQDGHAQPFCTFVDLHLPAINDAFPSPFGSVTQFLYNGCYSEWNNQSFTSNISAGTNYAFQFWAQNNMLAYLYACVVFQDGIISAAGSAVFVDGYTLVQGAQIFAAGGGYVGLGQVACADAIVTTFNTSGDGITTQAYNTYGAGVIQQVASRYGTASIVGAGNAGVGWRVGRGQTNNFSIVPLITGTGGDFALDTATTAFAFSNTTGAYVATQVACTWALLETNLTGTGFGGSAHFPRSNTHLIGPDVN